MVVFDPNVSVSGAGDTVIASFAYARLRWPDLNSDCWLHFASHAAGIVVAKPFTATVSRDEIFRRIGDDNRFRCL